MVKSVIVGAVFMCAVVAPISGATQVVTMLDLGQQSPTPPEEPPSSWGKWLTPTAAARHLGPSSASSSGGGQDQASPRSPRTSGAS
ncbi:MAG: hypothetical protein IPL75_09235 [Acidobacteria bacterium]|nr:hypothetical protein [Acidobacteriota bacterium]